MDEVRSTQGALTERALALIESGQATTRTELSQHLGAAASTISAAVQQLLSRGLVVEEGVQSSAGGRPRRVLRVGGSGGYALAADVGRHHIRCAAVRPGGVVARVRTEAFDVTVGPEAGLEAIAKALDRLRADVEGEARAVGVALPGPVDIGLGGVHLPSSMPGWDGFRVRDWVADRFELAAAVENDANLMAIAETAVRGHPHQDSITVKAGTAIGAGVMIGGRLHRGATGAAGDISHVRIDAAAGIPCACGNVGCLETVSSGAALVRILTDQGEQVSDTLDVVREARDGNPLATTAVRRAGGLLGEVLSANVNFFNPDAVYLGGILATLEPFVASVRSQLYDGCHPIVTEGLPIERTRLGIDTCVVGAGLFALEHVADAAR